MPIEWNTFFSCYYFSNCSNCTENSSKKYSENCRNIEMLLALWQQLTLYMYTWLWHVLGNHKKFRISTFYTLQLLYNSQLFVFYSAQSPIMAYGNATNWNRNSWEEIYPQQRKWSADFLKGNVVMSPGQYNYKRSLISTYKRQICFRYLDFLTIFYNFQNMFGPLNETERNFPSTIQHFTRFSLYDKLQLNPDIVQNTVWLTELKFEFLAELEALHSSTAFITL